MLQAATVLTNASGKYSDEQRFAAYDYLISSAGQAAQYNTDSATQAAVNSALSSSFVQNIENVQNNFIKSLSNVSTAASKVSDGLTAEVAVYQALSPQDQQLVTPIFQGLTGDQWVSLTKASAGLSKIVEQAPGGYQSSDPRVQQAIKLGTQLDNNGQPLSAAQQIAWTQEAQDFLNQSSSSTDQSSSSPAVVVTLSKSAQAAVASGTTGDATVAKLASNAESGLLTQSDVALQLFAKPGATSSTNATTTANGSASTTQNPANSPYTGGSKLDLIA